MTGLADVLATLYPTQGDIRRILDEAQISMGRINLNDSASNIWSRVLEQARDNQQMWGLIKIPLQEYSKNEALHAAWESELSSRRSSIAQFGGGDTAMSLLIDLIWDTRNDQKEIRAQVSELRHESRGRLDALEKLTVLQKAFMEGQAVRIEALEQRPESYATRVVLLLALLVGAIGGLLAGMGRVVWQAIVRAFGG